MPASTDAPPKAAVIEGSAVRATEVEAGRKVSLLRVLGPGHVWALGVGIVLVGEFMGWNFAVGKGGPTGALIACWLAGILYTCVAMIDSEVTSTVAAAGGQYAQAKHIIGPLMAFNVGLYLVTAYTMLAAADVLVVGDLLRTIAAERGYPNLNPKPFVLLTVCALALLNYRGVLMTLTLNFVITAIAAASIMIFFFAGALFEPGAMETRQALMVDLPYGWYGVLAALHFGLWFYLGIEGTCQAAEEVRSPARSLPYGTMAGMITLLIAAMITWYLCTGVLPWQYLGQAVTPLYDAARVTGMPWLQVLLFVGTMFAAIASANGCINDASRAWFSMGRDRYVPVWFGAVHPHLRTPNRSILFLVPIVVAFAYVVPLDQVVTFSILSGLLGYTFMAINMIIFRKKWPLNRINRGYVHPFHPIPAIMLLVLCATTYVAIFLGYGAQLIAMIAFYFIASIWFAFHRYRFVRRGDQFTMPWPRPEGY